MLVETVSLAASDGKKPNDPGLPILNKSLMAQQLESFRK
jgi:hypothetical protein